MTPSGGLLRYVVVFLAVLFSGCVTLERSYPERRYFMIEVPDEQNTIDRTASVLSVPNLHISPRYADRNFVYRTSETEYEADFYNQFLSSPATMISEEVRQTLAAKSPFKFVVGATNSLAANYLLEGSINVLYGDFRNPAAPAAVMEIEFFLHNENPGNPGLVLQKRYESSVPLKETSPEALVRGWSEGLNEIIARFVADLRERKL